MFLLLFEALPAFLLDLLSSGGYSSSPSLPPHPHPLCTHTGPDGFRNPAAPARSITGSLGGRRAGDVASTSGTASSVYTCLVPLLSDSLWVLPSQEPLLSPSWTWARSRLFAGPLHQSPQVVVCTRTDCLGNLRRRSTLHEHSAAILPSPALEALFGYVWGLGGCIFDRLPRPFQYTWTL